MDNFEAAIEAEYSDGMISKVEEVLRKNLPEYTRDKVVIIKVIDLK